MPEWTHLSHDYHRRLVEKIHDESAEIGTSTSPIVTTPEEDESRVKALQEEGRMLEEEYAELEMRINSIRGRSVKGQKEEEEDLNNGLEEAEGPHPSAWEYAIEEHLQSIDVDVVANDWNIHCPCVYWCLLLLHVHISSLTGCFF